MPGRPSPLLLATIGAALLAGLAAVVTMGTANRVPMVNVLILTWLTVAYSISGLVAWWCRPANRFGPLMVLTGASTILSSLHRSANEVLHTIGQVADLLPLVLIVHVFLTFPTGRLNGPRGEAADLRRIRGRGRRSARGHAARRPPAARCWPSTDRPGLCDGPLQRRAQPRQRRRAGRRGGAGRAPPDRGPAAAPVADPADRLVRGRPGDDRPAAAGRRVRRPGLPGGAADQPRCCSASPRSRSWPGCCRPGWPAARSATWWWSCAATRRICGPRSPGAARPVAGAGVLAAAVRRSGPTRRARRSSCRTIRAG